jgi:hypothetical protein
MKEPVVVLQPVIGFLLQNFVSSDNIPQLGLSLIFLKNYSYES